MVRVHIWGIIYTKGVSYIIIDWQSAVTQYILTHSSTQDTIPCNIQCRASTFNYEFNYKLRQNGLLKYQIAEFTN